MDNAINTATAQTCPTPGNAAAIPVAGVISVLIVEDQPLTLVGIKLSLAEISGFQLIGEATSGPDAVSEALRLTPNVILMDVELPRMDGIEAAKAIKKLLPKTRIIMFTSHTSPSVVFAALKAGADGFLSKNRSLDEISAAISAVYQGVWWLDPEVADSVALASVESAIPLSKVETFVLSSLRDGMTISQLATKLGATQDAITSVIKGIFRLFAAVPETSFDPDCSAIVEQPCTGDLFEEKYLIQGIAGKGGAGLVYRANHIYMGREVAIKMLHSDVLKDAAAVDAFRQEAMAVACLEHPNIIGVHDFGVSMGGYPYLIMEYAEAATLRQMLESQIRLQAVQFLDIFIPICDALRSAHAMGIIHCDLKPANILVKQESSGLIPKLADFGLAKFVRSENLAESPASESGVRVVEGTPPYMSPEQCLGEPVDQCSDIYSMGCVMFEALTGRQVFCGKDAMATFSQHLHKAPLPLNQALHGVQFSPVLESCIAAMLEKKPQKRIQTMDEICTILQVLGPTMRNEQTS